MTRITFTKIKKPKNQEQVLQLKRKKRRAKEKLIKYEKNLKFRSCIKRILQLMLVKIPKIKKH